MTKTKKRIVIAGFGDTGLLAGIHLSKDFDVVGISAKPCLVSGQELGTRLTKPEQWKKQFLVPFRRYRKLDAVDIVQGLIVAVDTSAQSVAVEREDGSVHHAHYDVLIIASGVSNGFWRNNQLEHLDGVNDNIERNASTLSRAHRVAIIGGGATGVSVSANLAVQYPDKDVHLFYSQNQPLPGYHPQVRSSLEKHLQRSGVTLHPEYRAQIPDGFACDEITHNATNWSTGQQAFTADATLWAVGKLRPNSSFLPADMLNADGFVNTDQYLRVAGYDNVFALGDIAATDPNRSSARNWGFRLVAGNIKAYLAGDPAKMKPFSAPVYRWGSILGVQAHGLKVFQHSGGHYRFPLWAVKAILFPYIVNRMIYRGLRS